MEDDPPGSTSGSPPERPESLLPYDLWIEEAQRQVVTLALAYAAENGLPGEHHFYISFRTDARGVAIPPRLLAQYPNEITIVLQHQFWDLKLDDAGRQFSVGLSFGGIPSTLTIPLSAVTGFADPHVQFSMRFTPPAELAADDVDVDKEAVEPEAPELVPEETPEKETPSQPQVVSLDAFRKRTPTKET